MKKIKTFLTAAAILAAITQSAYAAEIPVESAPENATTESIAITENLISPILDEVQNGLGYQPAWCKAHNAVFNAVLLSDLICEVENGTKDYDTALKEAYTKIYQTINPAYVPNEEIGIDRIYLDIPAADTVMFTQARKLFKEAQTRSVQK